MHATKNHEDSVRKSSDAVRLRFGGVYQSERKDGHWDYLRFYPDGTVLETSSAASPAKVAQRLRREYIGSRSVSHGRYLVRKNLVSFFSRFGVDCEGHIDGLVLELSSYNHINGHRASMTYSFVDLNT